jgi:hypothetical protein
VVVRTAFRGQKPGDHPARGVPRAIVSRSSVPGYLYSCYLLNPWTMH